MSLLRDIAAAREEFAGHMTELVVIGRWESRTDPANGDPVEVLVGAPTYEGDAQLKFPSVVISEKDVQGQQVAAVDVLLKLPVGAAPNVRVDDVARVTESVADDMLVGRRFRVKGPPQSGQVSAHRFPVEEVP